MDGNNFVKPKDYFAEGFFTKSQKLNPKLLDSYAKSSANNLIKENVPEVILENSYNQLLYFFSQEKELNTLEVLVDIMRSSLLVEPYVKYPFLLELIENGLLATDSEQDIEAFFLHFQKIIDLYKYGKLEGIKEY